MAYGCWRLGANTSSVQRRTHQHAISKNTIIGNTVLYGATSGILLAEGIGDTIRVSLSAPPVEEVKVGISILVNVS